jgi:peptidoglycan/LPS O-acetylase OafA/YrhL
LGNGDIIRPLHGLRGIAAVSVLAGHVAPVPIAPNLGVALFFVLSGFLMSHLYLSRPISAREAAGFVISRFARIYPLFAVVILVAGSISLLANNPPFRLEWHQVAGHLLLAGGNRTVWTITVEFQFYAAFLAIWFFAGRYRKPAVLGALFGMAVAASALAGMDAGKASLLRYIPIFMAGVLLGQCAVRETSARARYWKPAFLLLLALYPVVIYLARSYYDAPDRLYADPLVWAYCGSLVFGAATLRSGLGIRFLSSRRLVWLGDISFGIYLIHRLAQWGGVRILGLENRSWMLFAFVAASTCLCATMALRLIESPSRKLIRRAGERLMARMWPPPAQEK